MVWKLVGLVIVGTMLEKQTVAAVQFEERSLGQPLKVAVPIASAWLPDADGQMVFYATSGAQSLSQFARFDPRTGQAKVWPCPEANEIWAIAQAPDGRVYFGGRGNVLFRYDPAKDEVERVGASPSKNFVRALCAAPDGKVYGGDICHTNLLWVYDPATDTFRELGHPGPGDYVCSLAWTDDGHLLAALGTPSHLCRVDPATGASEELLPAEYQTDNFAYALWPCGRAILLRLAISNQLLLLRRDTGEFLRPLLPPEGASSLSLSFVDRAGRLWLRAEPLEDWFIYDSETDELTRHSLEELTAWPRQELPIQLFYSFRWDFTLTRRTSLRPDAPSEEFTIPIERTPHDIFSVGIGPDEKLYVEAYQWLHVTQVDPDTGEARDLGYLDPRTSGEIYSWLAVGDELLIAKYTHGMVYRYDPARPWKPEPAPDANPRWVAQFDNDIYRPMYLCQGPEGRLWVAGPCGYGLAGHGLGWLDLETGEHASQRLGGNAVFGLAAAPPRHLAVAQGGQLVFWDVERNQQDGEALFTDVKHVLADKQGHLYVVVGDTVKLLRAADRQVVRELALPPGGTSLLAWSRDDTLIAAGSYGIVAIDLATGETTPLTDHAPSSRYLVSDSRGNVYFSLGRDLRQLRRVGGD